MVSFKISVRLEEPVKLRTKLRIDGDSHASILPFESLTIEAKPQNLNGNHFEIKLNTPPVKSDNKQKHSSQTGIIRRLWQKIYHPPQKQKLSPNLSHIIEDNMRQCNNSLRGGEISEKTEEPKTENPDNCS